MGNNYSVSVDLRETDYLAICQIAGTLGQTPEQVLAGAARYAIGRYLARIPVSQNLETSLATDLASNTALKARLAQLMSAAESAITDTMATHRATQELLGAIALNGISPRTTDDPKSAEGSSSAP